MRRRRYLAAVAGGAGIAALAGKNDTTQPHEYDADDYDAGVYGAGVYGAGTYGGGG